MGQVTIWPHPGSGVAALKIFLSLFALLLATSSCITPQEKREMRADIFGVQTRLLTIEQAGQERDKTVKSTGDQASQKIANTGVELERLQRENAKMKGDIDALKIGVVTGKMPGAEGVAEGSLGAQMQALTTKIEAIEKNQSVLLEQVEKLAAREVAPKKDEKGKKAKNAGDSGKAKEKEKEGATTIRNLKDLRTAFAKGKYKQVNEAAPEVLKASDTPKDREEVLYFHAESLYKAGQMRDAALKYNELLDMNGVSTKRIPQAKLRLGDCFRHLGDAATAKLYYDEVQTKFGSTSEGTKAKERLAEMAKGSAPKQ